MKKSTIILASASPRRKELLKRIVRSFRVIPSSVDETGIKDKDPEVLAVRTALAKALDVARNHKRAIIIGADTIVVLGKKILGKPKNKAAATAMLKLLSGKTHLVITGLAVINPAKKVVATAVETTRVKMKKVKLKDINDYVASGQPLDKAGSYGIQEIEEVFIERIEGDYDNVVGLPISRLKHLLSNVYNQQ